MTTFSPPLAVVPPLDLPTVAAAAVTLLLIMGGYYERKALKKAPEQTCANCISPILDRVEVILQNVTALLSAHTATMEKVDAITDIRSAAIVKALDDLRVEMRDLRRDLGGLNRGGQ